jgi:hypothetical protein
LGVEDAAVAPDGLGKQPALVFLQAEGKLVVHGDALSWSAVQQEDNEPGAQTGCPDAGWLVRGVGDNTRRIQEWVVMDVSCSGGLPCGTVSGDAKQCDSGDAGAQCRRPDLSVDQARRSLVWFVAPVEARGFLGHPELGSGWISRILTPVRKGGTSNTEDASWPKSLRSRPQNPRVALL